MIQLEILKEKEMPLLERKRITAKLSFTGATPRRTELRKDIAKKQKVDEKLVAIRHVFQTFGSPNAKVIAHIYKDFKALCWLEKDGKNIQAEMKKEEEAKAAEAKAAEVKEEPKVEEAPKEEVKEEPKVEEAPKEEVKEEPKGEE